MAISLSCYENSTSEIEIVARSTEELTSWHYSLDGGKTWTWGWLNNVYNLNQVVSGLESKVYQIMVKGTRKSDGKTIMSNVVTCDITAPPIEMSIVSTASAVFYIKATCVDTCCDWEYTVDGGATWKYITRESVRNVSKMVTVSNVTKACNIQVRAYKLANSFILTSEQRVFTPGRSVLNSVSTLAIDEVSPTLKFNWTVGNASYNHELRIFIMGGATPVLTIGGLTGSVGTTAKSYKLTEEERTTLLRAMSNITSAMMNVELVTFKDTTELIDDSPSVESGISTTPINSAPIFTGFTVKDIYMSTTSVTNNPDIIIQNCSRVKVTFDEVVVRNEATIDKYEVTIGDTTKSTSAGYINWGKVATSGDVTVTVTAIDSRGYTATQTQTIYVTEYIEADITSWSIRRQNEVEAQIQVVLNGRMSPIYVDGVNVNKIQSVKYRYWKTTESTASEYIDITESLVTTDSGFSYTNMNFISLDPEYTYNVQFYVNDMWGSTHTILTVNKGIPLVALRSQKVGINNPNPESALDVVGNIAMNGFLVMGFVRELSADEDIDDMVTNGIYTLPENYKELRLDGGPVNQPGWLEVITNPIGGVLQRYTAFNGGDICFRCKFQGTWGSWEWLY